MTPGYENIGLVLLAAMMLIPAVPATILFRRLLKSPDATERRKKRKTFFIVFLLTLAAYALALADGFILEPSWVKIERISLKAPLPKPLTILQLSDLHWESGQPRRQAWLLKRLSSLNPDLILLTGDVHQLGLDDPSALNPLFSALHAPLGVFGCLGLDEIRMLQQAAPNVKWLENEAVILDYAGTPIGLAGLSLIGNHQPFYDTMQTAPCRIVMSHTPDLASEAAAHNASLYLCGHTHGGQIRIPFWGAVITNAQSGKKFEAGLYRQGNTPIYTSRGFGLEPRPAPQARFLCRPEITLFTLEPETGQSSPQQQ